MGLTPSLPNGSRHVACDIPYLAFRPQNADPGSTIPTVVFYHGWHSSKEYKRFTGSVLAASGFQAIVPDALHHGERCPVDHDDPRMLDLYFWPIIRSTVAESTEFLEHLVRHQSAERSRIAVMGSSMGGFSAAAVLTANPQVRCAVILNGSCSWVHAENIFRQMDSRPPLTAEESFEYEAYDPASHLESLFGRPVLMLHGTHDSSVPIESQRAFVQKASAIYAGFPERLRLSEFHGLNHYVTVNMLEESIEWLSRYL